MAVSIRCLHVHTVSRSCMSPFTTGPIVGSNQIISQDSIIRDVVESIETVRGDRCHARVAEGVTAGMP